MTILKNIIDKYKEKYDLLIIDYFVMEPIKINKTPTWNKVWCGICKYDKIRGLRPLDADIYELDDLGEEDFIREMTNEELYGYNRDLKASYTKGLFIDFVYNPRKDDGLL